MCDVAGFVLSCESRAHSESLLSELEPLELLLPEPEELLLLSRDGPPEGAEPAFSGGDAAGESRSPTHPRAPLHAPGQLFPSTHRLHTDKTHASAHPLLHPVALSELTKDWWDECLHS